jgi:hypothetical protein
MSESDLSNLIYLAMGMATSLFEFWLSASFALALVSHFAAGKLSGPILKLLAAIYLLASASFFLGWLAFSSQVTEYMAVMVEQEYQTEHFNNLYGIAHGVGIISVFIIGTMGIIYYLLWTLRQQNDDT